MAPINNDIKITWDNTDIKNEDFKIDYISTFGSRSNTWVTGFDMFSNNTLTIPTMASINSFYILINLSQSFLDNTLPVTLTSFTAAYKNGKVDLNWRTESEVNNAGFIIDKRESGGDWLELSSYVNNNDLAGQGSTSVTTDYSYVDYAVEAGKTYEYRLTDVDTEGTKTVHDNDIQKVVVAGSAGINTAEKFNLVQVYPNPFNPVTKIQYNLEKESTISIMIYDVAGKKIDQLAKKGLSTSGNIVWDASDFSAGVYLMHITAGDYKAIKRCVLLK